MLSSGNHHDRDDPNWALPKIHLPHADCEKTLETGDRGVERCFGGSILQDGLIGMHASLLERSNADVRVET